MIEEEAEKILKFVYLTIEIHETWNGKTNVIQGNCNHLKIVRKIPGKHEVRELQTTAILGTTHKLREVLMYKYKPYLTWQLTLHVAYIVNTEELQHHVP